VTGTVTFIRDATVHTQASCCKSTFFELETRKANPPDASLTYVSSRMQRDVQRSTPTPDTRPATRHSTSAPPSSQRRSARRLVYQNPFCLSGEAVKSTVYGILHESHTPARFSVYRQAGDSRQGTSHWARDVLDSTCRLR
jgi:hypothetical protein